MIQSLIMSQQIHDNLSVRSQRGKRQDHTVNAHQHHWESLQHSQTLQLYFEVYL